MRRIIKAMLAIGPGTMTPTAVSIPSIRAKTGMADGEFKRTLFEMSQKGIVRFVRHPSPGSLTKLERAELIDDGDRIYSMAVFRENASEKIAALAEQEPVEPLAETLPDNLMPVDQTTLAEQEPLPIMQAKSKGGKRAGAGRPKGTKLVNDAMLKLPVCIRLPRWMLNWLTDRGNVGSTIEQALIEVHKLTPPA